MTIREFNRLMLLACAPFVGLFLWLLAADWTLALPDPQVSPASPAKTEIARDSVLARLDQAAREAETTRTSIQKYYQLYEQSAAETAAMVEVSRLAAALPEIIFDNRLAPVIGRPRRSVTSDKIDLKLYYLKESAFDGYALKVRLKADNAMTMALGDDRVPGSETTLSVVRRYGAVAGINAGGYADDSRGRRYPLSATVLNGQFVNPVDPTASDLVFVGLNRNRQLVGTRYSNRHDIERLKPVFGASFVPVLLKDGQKRPIPAKWQTSPRRAPRTVVGRFTNEQLLFIVTDGYDENGNSGATLAELQDLMSRMRIRDAYNLDGGGSSTLVFDGQLINRPSDGRMRELPTHFLFFK